MRPGTTHKTGAERLLTAVRARVAAALEALDAEDGVARAREQLEAAEKAVRALQVELGTARLSAPEPAGGAAEHPDTRRWLVKTFTEEDPEAADGHHGLRVSAPSSFPNRRQSVQELDAQMNQVLGVEPVRAALARAGAFDFDAPSFSAMAEVQGRQISVIAAHLMQQNRFVADLRRQGTISDSSQFWQALLSFLGKLDGMYSTEVKYHTAAHAVDVISTTEWLLRSAYLRERTTALDRFMGLIASAIHDAGHPGTNNLFHSKTMAPLAIRYNDRSVLESMHLALSFEAMQQDSSCDWFSMLSRNAPGQEPGAPTKNLQQYVRKGLICMVLATDLAKHAKHVRMLETFVTEAAEEPVTPTDSDKQKALETTIFLMETVLHASDISNPTKPKPLMLEWVRRVLDEFWAQGDEERRLGLEISPLCDRETGRTTVGKGQIGFITFVVQPYFRPLVELIPEAREANEQLALNRAFWEAKDKEQATFEDIFGAS